MYMATGRRRGDIPCLLPVVVCCECGYFLLDDGDGF